jgi:hypothetical protein
MTPFSTSDLFIERFVDQVTSHEARIKTGTVLAIPDSVLQIEDNSDSTKVLTFSVGGITAATTRTITVPDYDLTLGSGVGGLKTVVDTGGAFATPIVLTAADSGKHYLLDDAAGLDFTLPAIVTANVGMQFIFYLQTEPTSNSYRWTAQAADLLIGQVVIYDKDVAEGSTEALLQIMRPDGSDDLITTITGTDDTQGSLVGGWLVRGSLIGDGALATIFS